MLAIFDFQGQSIRTAQDERGNTWFCLIDLLGAMNSKTHTPEAKALIEETLGDWYVILVPTTDALQREREAIFIHEDATTFLVSRSRTKIGKELCRWIYAEVLPSIRKTGSYSLNQQPSKVDTTTDRYEELEFVLDKIDKRLGKGYGDRVFLENIKAIHKEVKFPSNAAVNPKKATNKEEILLAKIFKKAQYQGSITPRQVQQNFTNRSRKLSIDNARAYLRKLCEMGLGYIDGEGTFVPHIDDEIMAQLAQ